MKYSGKFCGIVALACAVVSCHSDHDKPTVAPPVKVAAVVIGAKNSPSATDKSYSGTVAAANSTTVSFSVPGTVEQIYVDEGQRVAAGQALAKLKSGDYVNADNIAKAQLAEANDAYARLKKLHDADALPDVKWVEIEQKVQQARNAVEMSERALKETTLRSPVAGVVSRKFADRGENVAPIEPVFEIVSVDRLTIDISVPENQINNIAVNAAVVVKFDGMDALEGEVSQKSVVADALTRSYKVKIDLPETKGRILPGMIGTVTFAGTVPEAAGAEMVLPTQAVTLSNDNRTFVWTVVDEKTQRRFVKADRLVADGVVVTEGLNPGDTVVVEGMQKVSTGSSVNVELR